jgi:hypothetical protein
MELENKKIIEMEKKKLDRVEDLKTKKKEEIKKIRNIKKKEEFVAKIKEQEEQLQDSFSKKNDDLFEKNRIRALNSNSNLLVKLGEESPLKRTKSVFSLVSLPVLEKLSKDEESENLDEDAELDELLDDLDDDIYYPLDKEEEDMALHDEGEEGMLKFLRSHFLINSNEEIKKEKSYNKYRRLNGYIPNGRGLNFFFFFFF